MERVENPEALFTFDVLNEDGEVEFTLEKHDEEFFKVRYPAGMTHDEAQKRALSYPYPIYDGCVYEVNQLAVLLYAYSPSEFERFLEAYEAEGGKCITLSQTI